MPSFDIAEEAISGAKSSKALMMTVKAAANLLGRLTFEVLAVSKVGEVVMPYLKGTDPTNGAAALVSMMHSDPNLLHDFRILSTLVHKLINSGVSLSFIEEALKKREDIINVAAEELAMVEKAAALL